MSKFLLLVRHYSEGDSLKHDYHEVTIAGAFKEADREDAYALAVELFFSDLVESICHMNKYSVQRSMDYVNKLKAQHEEGDTWEQLCDEDELKAFLGEIVPEYPRTRYTVETATLNELAAANIRKRKRQKNAYIFDQTIRQIKEEGESD